MSRTLIAAVVAAVIVALTAIAFFVTSTSFDERARKDADQQTWRATQLIYNVQQLAAIDVSNKAERLASRAEFVAALKASGDDRRRQAQIGFQKFVATSADAEVKPDIIALVDATGDIVAMHEVSGVVPRQWKTDKGESILPAINLALGRRIIISDFWNYGDKGLMRVGVAPVIDPEAPINQRDPDGVSIFGAIVVAYAQTTRDAQQNEALLGSEVGYFDGKRAVTSSFTRAGSVEDTARTSQLTRLLDAGSLPIGGTRQKVSIDGVDYLAAAIALPRSSTKALPAAPEYPAVTAGAVVLTSLAPSSLAATAKLLILVVGIGALAMTLLGLYLAHRRLIAQVDEVELGVTDIINGNVDRTFRPVGPELEGLSNGLNVMLARLLGRPEPGEEELDEDGNPIVLGTVEFEESEEGAPAPAADPDLAALAQESEPDYYKRVYTEYLAAKRQTGHPDEVSFENFIAKLKVNEGKLRAQYQCRTVRFRVVVKDDKVSLKPVPIFA